MTKEEFESWVESDSRIQEAFDRLPQSDRSLEKWLKLFALSLATIAKEEAGEEPEEDETLSEELDEEIGDGDGDEEDGSDDEEED